ncbi:MAG: AAA family ATPase [Streptosporangiaceae bacterium]|nr:AAA family ATPase [Streptosporangiaceae bacterium]
MAGLALGRLYERDAELGMAADLLSRAADSRGGVLFYAGNAGLGKTALVKHVIGEAAGDFRVGQAAGDPAETSLAFSFLGQAIDALGCPVSLAEADTGGRGVRDVRSMRFHRVLRWLREVSEPVLLTLDDLQWADSDSLAMLSFLCRRLDGLAVAVIGTLRSWPPSAYDVARRLWAAGRAGLVELAPLTDPAAGRVVTERVPGQADAATIGRAVALCAGNPLLLEHVSGLIRAGDDLTSPQLSREPQNPRPLLLSRFAGLRADALRCARAASVLGTTFQPSLAAKLARVPEKTVERTLDALARSGLVREIPGHLMEFVHPLFSQLLYEDLGAALRDQLHHRACHLLLNQGLDREAAWHAMHGHVTGDPAALAALERAGLDALRQGAVEAATEHLRAAVTQAGQRTSRAALTGLCEALLTGGQFREAIAYCERLVAMPAESPRELARALMIRATGLAQAGRLDEACMSLDETAAAAKDTDVPLAVDAQTQHGYYRWWLSGPAAALPILAQARELAGPNGTRAPTLWGFVALQAGDPSGMDGIAAASRAVLAAPRAHLSDFTTTWGALASFAVCATLTERFAHAEQACAAALEAAEQAGAGRTAGSLGLSVAYAELLLRLGRLPEALSLTAAVLELRDAMPALAVTASVIHAEILMHLGRLDEADQWLAHAEAAPAVEASWEPALRLRRIMGQRALRAGEWHTASTCLREAEELSIQAGIGEPCLSMWGRPAVVAYLRAGRTADAKRVVDWLDRCAARLPCRWPRIAALCARAGLAELAGDPAAEAAFTEALRLHDGLPLPLERIETLLEYGSFLRRAGASARARPLLGEAMSAAEAIGADWLARHAHRELTASGGRRRRRETASRLTPRERRVFELAAQGLSNEAIASRLQISAGTVKTHLEHIYTKFGIHSRRELMLRRTEIPASLTVCRETHTNR